MPEAKYPQHEALNPFFEVVMKGLNGLVDGDHYFDTIALGQPAREFLFLNAAFEQCVKLDDTLLSGHLPRYAIRQESGTSSLKTAIEVLGAVHNSRLIHLTV